MRKIKRSKSRLNQTRENLVSPSQFRRLIHSDGDLIRGISKFRNFLSSEAIPDVIDSIITNPIYRNTLAPDAFPKSYSRIRSRFRLMRADPEIEMTWSAAILSHFKLHISKFVDYKRQFASAYLSGEYNLAELVLDELEHELGLSIWSTNAKITLCYVRGGTSAQKTVLDKIIGSQGIDAIFAYTTYFLSYSLEENVTLADIRREFSDTSSDLAKYFRYQISPFDLSFIDDPSVCVYMDETSPIIDRYETMIDAISIYLSRPEKYKFINNVVRLLGIDNDLRLNNQKIALGMGDCPFIDTNFIDACDAYTQGNYSLADQILSASQKEASDKAWAYELAARTDAALGKERIPNSIADQIIIETRAFLYLDKDLGETQSSLHRLGILTRKLLPSYLVSSLLDRGVDLPISTSFTPAQLAIAVGSPTGQPSNYAIWSYAAKENFEKIFDLNPIESSIAHQLHIYTIMSQDPGSDIASLSVPFQRERLYSAYGLFNRGRYGEATERLLAYRESVPAPENPRSITFEYALLQKQGLIDRALAAFVEAFFANSRSPALYDMVEFTAWAVSQAAADHAALDRAILLHVYSSRYDSARDGDLSDALEDALDYYSSELPSGLINQDFDPKRLIYFLRFIATIDRLEDTTRFETFDEIEGERLKILQWLVQKDQINRNAYTQEISAITKDREVARLSARLERSKIYVHEEGIRRTFESEIRPTFLRYRQMLTDPEMGARMEQIEQRIRKLLKDSDSDIQYLILPSTERDAVYVSMVQRALDIFGLDPTHGFKTYLSTRILHGVLEGALRSSFVNEGLLVSTDSQNKELEALERWEPRLLRFSDYRQVEMCSHIVRFSNRVTESISLLKDRRIRVYSRENPDALFKIILSEAALDKLKGSVTASTTYEEFFDRLFTSCWDSTEDCLHNIKSEINGVFKKQILSSFDSLESALSSSTGERPSEVLDAVARARAAFALDLERISAWFARSGVMSRDPFEISTAVEVASRITNNCYPEYPLEVHVEQKGTYTVAGDLLNPVVDLLTNCFQNAAEHSGYQDRAPEVSVTVGLDESRDLVLTVQSRIAESIDIEQRASEIEGLLSGRDVLDPGGVAEEGRTGIRKMKRILRHDIQSQHRLQITVMQSEGVRVRFVLPRAYIDEHRAH